MHVISIIEFGVWSKWSPWTECSLSCNNGTKLRERVCDTPGALCLKLNGQSDIKEKVQEECNIEPCNRKEL